MRVQLRPLTTALMVATRGDPAVEAVPEEATDEERAVAFAKGTPATDTSALDHIALRCDDFELDDAKAWLAKHDVPILNSGTRYGADGNGFSIYVNDPEGNVVELKCG